MEKVLRKISFSCLGHSLRDDALGNSKYSRIFSRNWLDSWLFKRLKSIQDLLISWMLASDGRRIDCIREAQHLSGFKTFIYK